MFTEDRIFPTNAKNCSTGDAALPPASPANLNRREVLGMGLLAATAATTLGASAALAEPGNAAPALTPMYLRCEYRVNPLGIGEALPRFSWLLESTLNDLRGQSQSAYDILVASSPELLAADKGDLWASGKVFSTQTNQIVYGGKALDSRQQCWWKVRIYNQAGVAGPWSDAACWTMGLLKKSEWKAKWIGFDALNEIGTRSAQDAPLINFNGIKWTRVPASLWKFDNVTWQPAPPPESGLATPPAYFRHLFAIPSDREIRRATFFASCDDDALIRVNGQIAGRAYRWELAALLDVTKLLTAGDNVATIEVTQQDGYPPSVIGRLVIEFVAGDPLVIPVGGKWKVSLVAPVGWQNSNYNDATWIDAEEMKAPLWGTSSQAAHTYSPARYLRNTFHLGAPVRRATLYATALGLYKTHINGQVVGEDYLTPGWTDYHRRVYYNTYDVTHALKEGENAIGAILGDGWFAGNVGAGGRRHYGGVPRFAAQLEIELADGTKRHILSDETWKAAYGPIRYNDIYVGCCIDNQLDISGWDQPEFGDGEWTFVNTGVRSGGSPLSVDVTETLRKAIHDNRLFLTVSNSLFGRDPAPNRVKMLHVRFTLGGKPYSMDIPENQNLALGQTNEKLKIIRARYQAQGTQTRGLNPEIQAIPNEPVRVAQKIAPRELTQPRPGLHTFDMGQNMVGWVRLKVRGPAGRKIVIRHGETKNPNGTTYTSNLRGAMATDVYYLKGNGEEILEPAFTFHGFRYVEVRGLDYNPELSDLTGVVIHSDFKRTGHFACSSPAINQLYRNIIWSQRGNHISIPTDCPQRDERLGWTGDTQFFIPTGTINFDVAAFFTSWLVTLCQDSQAANGSFADVAPSVWGDNGVTAWGDAALICTHQIYRNFGDTRIIERHYPAMKRYFKYPASLTHNNIMTAQGFGDWLNMGGGASMQVIGTAYYAMLTEIMAEMATAIGRHDDAQHYHHLHEALKQAFVDKLILPDGTIRQSSQTGFALAFTMNLVPENMRKRVAEKFVADIRHRNWHLATGFIGTPRLLPALHLAGHDDVAYKLLFQSTLPSWLYQVKTGGSTTMWERWNGWSKSHGFASITMNSFNHYAFGAVGQYLYKNIAGIETQTAGYQKILLRPTPGRGLNWARAEYEAISGKISCGWQLRHGTLAVNVDVPINTTARLFMPAHHPAAVRESGKPAAHAFGVKVLSVQGQLAELELVSGHYSFTSEWSLSGA